MKQIKKKVHNALLWTITVLAGLGVFLGMCTIDSDNIWPPIMLILGCWTWIFLFCYANEYTWR